MNKNPIFASMSSASPHRSLQSGVKRFFALMTTLLTAILLGVLFTSCSVSVGSGLSPQTPPTTASGVDTVNCNGYEKTGGGITKTYTVNVNSGCDIIVQGVEGHNVGSYDWNNGGIVALGPGNYTFTITDGSYQIASDAMAPTVFCNGVHYIQNGGYAFGYGAHPLAGWGSC